MARLSPQGEKTFVHPGDPIWIVRDGQEQADAGTFKEGPLDGRMKVQTASGDEWVPENQVCHRRPGQDPGKAIEGARDGDDPLSRVAEVIEFLIGELDAEMKRTAAAAERATNTARSAKREKGHQIKVLRRCLPILRRQQKTRKPHRWSPEQREAASRRMIKMNQDRRDRDAEA